MTYHEYLVAKELHAQDATFYGLIMAAMWKADSDNTARLRAAWPDVYDELYARYHAPGGLLDGETVPA